MAKCKVCGSQEHSQFYCKLKPRKPIQVKKPMNKIGRVGKETAKAVAKWKRGVKPNHQGYYECYICHKWVTYNMAEHVKSKVRNPHLRTDQNNFKTTCDDCNREKGSKDN